MLIHEAIYDLDELMKENLHIHTAYSRCANKEMQVKSVIKEAERSGLKTIAITNHIHPHEDVKLTFLEDLRNEINSTETNVKVLLGEELSAYGVGKYVESAEINKSLDYRLYAYNHYHQDYWIFPEERTARGFWNLANDVLRKLFEDKRADCIAHPFMCGTVREYITDGGNADDTYVNTVIKDDELGDLLKLGTDSGVAWELNSDIIHLDPVFYRRMFNIGREVGAVFNFGTDAHKLNKINDKEELEEVKRILL